MTTDYVTGRWRANAARLRALVKAAEADRDEWKARAERLAGLVDCDLDATARHANALEDENQAHTLSAASRNTLQDRLTDVSADRDRWEESSGNLQTLYQQECDRREQADAVLREYMVIGTVENFAEMRARLAAVAALCDERACAWGEDTRSPAVPRWIREVRDALAAGR